jgi:hypothetical protein
MGQRRYANVATTKALDGSGEAVDRPSVDVKDLRRDAGVRLAKPPVLVTGRGIRELRILLTSSVALAFVGLAVLGHFWLNNFAFIPLAAVIISWRCTIWGTRDYGVRFAPYPAGVMVEGNIKLNRQAIRLWSRWLLISTLVTILLVADGIVPDIFIAIMIVCALWCVGFVWCLDVVILSIERDIPEQPIDHNRRQIWSNTINAILSHGLTTISTALASLLLLVTFVCLITGTLLRVWPFVLALAFVYLLLGSVMRAAQVTRNRVWIDVDGAQLLDVLRQTFERGIWWSGAGTFIGAVVGGVIVFAKHKTGHEITDLMGVSLTVGGVTGTVIALFVPTKLAWLRRRKLRSSKFRRG